MKIIVLNGSPKGEISVTIQYVKYVQKHHPEHELKIISVAHEINGIERDRSKWQVIIDEVQSSDGVLWATPVYYFMVPSQLKRFIELIYERQAEAIFRGKYAAALITSIHCMDHTAMNYLTGISEDLSMLFVGGFSPEMDDLENPQEQTNLLNFAAYFLHAITTGVPTLRTFAPVSYDVNDYQMGAIAEVPKTGSKRIVLLTDGNDLASNLGQMIETFRRLLPNPVDVFDLGAIDIKGGCMGCLHCGYDNTCAYQDGLKQFIQEKLIPADAIIFAGAIRDRYLSSRWKMYFDRSFVFGHTPFLHGKQIGFIVSGPLRQLPNLRQLFEADIQDQQCNPVGFATDEDAAGDAVTAGLQALAVRLDWALSHDLRVPGNFLAAGLHLLYKGFVPRHSGVFRADHIYYKKHGMYKRHFDLKRHMENLMFAAMNSVPSMRKEFQKRMKQGMIADLKKIVDGAKPAVR